MSEASVGCQHFIHQNFPAGCLYQHSFNTESYSTVDCKMDDTSVNFKTNLIL